MSLSKLWKESYYEELFFIQTPLLVVRFDIFYIGDTCVEPNIIAVYRKPGSLALIL
jgi:hypothetical protein